MEEVVRLGCEKSADELVTAIFDAVQHHSAGVRAFDDETVVVVKIKQDSEAEVSTSKKRTKTSKALREV